MSGTTFDAGTVHAQMRLGRSEFKRELRLVKKELADFEKKIYNGRIGLDSAVFNREYANAQRKMSQFSKSAASAQIKLDLDSDRAWKDYMSFRAAAAATPDIKVKVDVDTRLADAALARLRWSTGAAISSFRMLSTISAVPSMLQLASSVGLAAGALAALVPAALAAAAVVGGTLAVGFHGLGDAIKETDPEKFAEAMAKISPAAREVVTSIRAMGQEWTALRLDVQQHLLQGLGKDVEMLGKAYLPVLRAGLVESAVGFNDLLSSVAGFALQKQSIADLGTIMGNINAATKASVPGWVALVAIFRDIAAVGSEFLPGFAEGWSRSLQNFSEFISQARDSGALRDFIAAGLEALTKLRDILVNVGDSLLAIFSAANASGGSFLDTLLVLTGQINDFLRSADGQQALLTLFKALNDTAVALQPAIDTILATAGQLVMALAPALPGIAEAFSALVVAAAPLVVDLGNLIANILPPFTAFIRDNAGLILGLAIGFGGLALAVKGFIAVATGISAITTAINAFRNAAWLATAAQWLWNAALSANPIGLVIIAIAALVAGLVWAWNSSETFRAVVIGVWNAIRDTAVAVFTWLGTFITDTWNWIRDTAISVWNGISAFFTGALAVFSAIWSAVWGAVSGFFSGIWNGIRTAAMAIWGAIVAYFTASFALYQAMFSAVWNTISAIFTTVWNWIRNTAVTIWSAIVAYFSAAFAVWTAFFTAVWNGIVSIFTGIWNWLRNVATTAWNGIYSFFTGAFAVFTSFFRSTWDNIVATFDRVWSSVTDIAKRVWDAVRGAFIDGVNTVIRIINGFADAINTVAGALGFNINLHINEIPKADGGPIFRRRDGGEILYKQVIRRADGGGIDASGGGKLPHTGKPYDSIPARAGNQPYLLMGDEWVVRRSSSRAIGTAGMAAINNADRRPVDVVPRDAARYASGGDLGAAAQRGVPGTRVTSTFRRGVAGYHGKNQAADLAGPGRMDTAFMHRINRWIADNHGAATTELIFTPGINLLNGRPHTYNAGTRADHHDHVHWAMAGPLGDNQGGWFDSVVTWLLDQAKSLLNPLRDVLVPIKDNPAEGFGKRALAGAGLSVIDWLFKKSEEADAASGGGGLAAPGSGPVFEQVKAVADRWGWGPASNQWGSLSALISKESSWNPTAQNPTSTAYGLFQFLNGTWGTVGGKKTSNPGEQTEYGLRYIKGKYRDPVGAWAFHRRNNWYDDGGVLKPGATLAYNGTGKDEYVNTSEQLGTLVRRITSAGEARGREKALVTAGAGIDAEQIRSIVEAVADVNRPLIGEVHTDAGVSAAELADELQFRLRSSKRGGVHRRGR